MTTVNLPIDQLVELIDQSVERNHISFNRYKLDASNPDFEPKFFQSARDKHLVLDYIVQQNKALYKCINTLEWMFEEQHRQILISVAFHQLLNDLNHVNWSGHGCSYDYLKEFFAALNTTSVCRIDLSPEYQKGFESRLEHLATCIKTKIPGHLIDDQTRNGYLATIDMIRKNDCAFNERVTSRLAALTM